MIIGEIYAEGNVVGSLNNAGGGISSNEVNSIMVVDKLPQTEMQGVLYLVKETIEIDTNLYPSQSETSINNGVKITFKDKKIIVDGGNETTSVWATSEELYMNLEANKPYYLQFTKESGSIDDSERVANSDGIVTSIVLTGYDNSGNLFRVIDEEERDVSGVYEKYAFMPTEEYAYYILQFQSKRYVTFNGWTLSIEIAEETENLYDYSTTSILNDAKVEDNTIVTGTNSNTITYLPVEPNTTYNIYKKINQHFGIGLSTDIPVVGTVFNSYDNDTSLSAVTVTTGANDNYLAIYYWTSSDTGTEEEIRKSIVVVKAK